MCRGRLADDPAERVLDRRLFAVEITAGAAVLVAWAVTGLDLLVIGVAIAAYALWRQDWLVEVPAAEPVSRPETEIVGASG